LFASKEKVFEQSEITRESGKSKKSKSVSKSVIIRGYLFIRN